VVARFVSSRKHDVGDCLGQLDVRDALHCEYEGVAGYSLMKYGWPSPVLPLSIFSLRFAVHFFHPLDRRGDKLLDVLMLRTRDLGVHDCVRIGPGRSFRIKNAWQSLLDSGAVIENSAGRCIDLKRRLGAVNDSARMRILRQTAGAKDN